LEHATRRKRTRYELLADLLLSSKGGARKTTLMFRANLSFALLNKYLGLLIENGFVDKKGDYFFPNRRGLTYLQKFSRYQSVLEDVNRTEQTLRSFLTIQESVGAAA